MKWGCIALWARWPWLLIPLVVMVGSGRDVLAEDPHSRGRRLFERYCSACHGLDGRGQGPAALALRTPPADLTQIAKRRGDPFPAAEIAASIDGRAQVQAHGSRDMPVWGQDFSGQVGGGSLGEHVVRDNLHFLIQYLESLQQ